MIRPDERADDAEKGAEIRGRVSEVTGVGDRADAAPRAAGGNEDRADQMEVQLDGQDRVHLAGGTERGILDLHRVRDGRAPGDVRRRSANCRERGSTNAVVFSLQLRDEGLRAGSGALAWTNCIGPMPELTATIGAGVGGTACGGAGAVGGEVIPRGRCARAGTVAAARARRKTNENAWLGDGVVLRLEGYVLVGDALTGVVVCRRARRRRREEGIVELQTELR